MFVKITLFKTDFDEENIFIDEQNNTLKNRVLALKQKYDYLELPKSAYNPSEPFRIAANAFDVKGVYNYAIFDFDATENENTPINKYRYYFIRDVIFVNDNVSQLIVKEDILPRVYNYLSVKHCTPESYTYKNEDIKKRNYKNLISDNIYKNIKSVAKPRVVYGGNNKRYAFFYLIVTCLSGEPYNYEENGTTYPFFNLIFPFAYNIDDRQIFDSYFYYKNSGDEEKDPDEIAGLNRFWGLSYSQISGFKIVSTCIIQDLPCVESITYEGEPPTGRFLLTFAKTYVGAPTVYKTDVQSEKITEKVLRIAYGFSYINTDIDISEQFFEDFFDEYGKIGYKKITLSCAQTEVDIDPLLLFNTEIERGEKILFWQSLVPPYNVSIGRIRDFYKDYENLYYEKSCVVISNTLSAGTYTDNYTEFLRSNYNSSITGLTVQQSADKELLRVQQDLQATQFLYGGIKGAVGAIAQAKTTGGLSLLSFGLDTAFEAANLASSQKAARESLSINQEKENALLGLRLADIKNTPDTASFYGAISECVEQGKYPRVNFWENVGLEQAKRGHKMYGFTLPKDITQIKSHNRFDYIRAQNITFSFNNFSPTEFERVEIEDIFNKGIRLWWTLDGYKDFSLDNPEQ